MSGCFVDVRTQAELDAALAAGDYPTCRGDGEFTASGSATVRASGSATVRASDSATVTASDSATVTAWGSATVRAWGSATVRASDSATVRAGDSATVRAWDSATVTAWDSATVRAWDSATVTASGSATVTASGSATVRAGKYVPVQDHGPNVKVTGGVLISIRRAETPEDWCDFYDVEVVDGIATLFKAVGDDWKGNTKTSVTYEPGSTPEAPDWRPTQMCGHGLHFSARPWMALRYYEDATRYVACPVALDGVVLLDDKIKAEKVAGATWECDLDGERIVAEAAAA